MVLNAWFGTKVIPTEVALLITAMLIAGSMFYSMWKTRDMPEAEATQAASKWWVPGSPGKSAGDKNTKPGS